MMELAPIALFAYNRPKHLAQTVESLLQNREAKDSLLYVFADGPKRNDKSLKAIEEVRSYIRNITGFKQVELIERQENYGLARNIISGVGQVSEQHGQVIVLEDDLYISPYFLKYMNDGLGKYKDEERVISLHAYIYPVEGQLPETFFLKGADCLGWATWKRGWGLFEPDGKKLLNQLQEQGVEYEFNFNGSYPYTQMLKDQIGGKNNSWAVRWYASAFLRDKLTLYPGKTLVEHKGDDAAGTNVQNRKWEDKIETNKAIELHSIPIEHNDKAMQMIAGFMRKKLKKAPLLKRIRNKIRAILRKTS